MGDIQHEKVLRMATAKPFPLLVIAVVEDNPADVYCITRVLHARMVVQLDNGPQVLVPTHLFIPQPDGSYALPCRCWGMADDEATRDEGTCPALVAVGDAHGPLRPPVCQCTRGDVRSLVEVMPLLPEHPGGMHHVPNVTGLSCLLDVCICTRFWSSADDVCAVVLPGLS